MTWPLPALSSSNRSWAFSSDFLSYFLAGGGAGGPPAPQASSRSRGGEGGHPGVRARGRRPDRPRRPARRRVHRDHPRSGPHDRPELVVSGAHDPALRGRCDAAVPAGSDAADLRADDTQYAGGPREHQRGAAEGDPCRRSNCERRRLWNRVPAARRIRQGVRVLCRRGRDRSARSAALGHVERRRGDGAGRRAG